MAIEKSSKGHEGMMKRCTWKLDGDKGAGSIAIMNMVNHFVWSRELHKNVMGEEKEEGGTRGRLGSSYKSRAPLQFFSLDKEHKCRPMGPKPSVEC